MGKSGIHAWEAETGTLRLTILDAQTGEPTPARVEVLDQEGKGYMAEDAIPVDGDRTDRKEPWTGTAEEALARLKPEVQNHFSRTLQFYSGGSSRLVLPSGPYHVKIRKGFEFETVEQRVEVLPGQESELTLRLPRWADMRAQGWYSADHHLHIARSHRDLDPVLSKWMQAEDIHIATFLRWGHSQGFHNTPQYAFGSDSVYRSGNYLLASGQENPRTHILGHTIMLGARDPIDFPDRYLIYRLFHEEAHRQGALSGYAHGGVALGALNGLSIDLPLQLLKFVEVHQIATGYYDVWYNILNTGFRLAAVAGTDYPFSRSLPGMERFYTRIEGPLTYEAWLEGIRQGRTFVTNGPLIDFGVGGRAAGDEPIPWTASECAQASTVHVGGTLEEICASERDMYRGRHGERPFLILCQQSAIDSSRAPEGKHTGYAYCHVPHGSSVDRTEAIEAQVERFAPGFGDLILARHTMNTMDFQRYNPNYKGGAITGGVADAFQLWTRPVARFDPYSTPNPKLFICSAATPPGGGVTAVLPTRTSPSTR